MNQIYKEEKTISKLLEGIPTHFGPSKTTLKNILNYSAALQVEKQTKTNRNQLDTLQVILN
jgi:hypothetical protein